MFVKVGLFVLLPVDSVTGECFWQPSCRYAHIHISGTSQMNSLCRINKLKSSDTEWQLTTMVGGHKTDL